MHPSLTLKNSISWEDSVKKLPDHFAFNGLLVKPSNVQGLSPHFPQILRSSSFAWQGHVKNMERFKQEIDIMKVLPAAVGVPFEPLAWGGLSRDRWMWSVGSAGGRTVGEWVGSSQRLDRSRRLRTEDF